MASEAAPGFGGTLAKVGGSPDWTVETGNGFDWKRFDEVIAWIAIVDDTGAAVGEVIDISFDGGGYVGGALVWGPIEASDGVTVAASEAVETPERWIRQVNTSEIRDAVAPFDTITHHPVQVPNTAFHHIRARARRAAAATGTLIIAIYYEGRNHHRLG